jgi:hypothetical protein
MARLSSTLVVGDRIWESGTRKNDKWSPGRIVAITDCPVRKNQMYMLIRDDGGLYTIYGCLKDCVCKPWVARRWAEEVGRTLMNFGFGHELAPEIEKIKKRRLQAITRSAPSPIEPEPEPSRILPEFDCPRIPLSRST